MENTIYFIFHHAVMLLASHKLALIEVRPDATNTYGTEASLGKYPLAGLLNDFSADDCPLR